MWQKSKNIYHLLIATLANTYYLFPARKLQVVGITGTDGKTTTTSLVYHILKTAGKNVSLISTVAAYIGNKTYDTGFHVTNPSSFPLQRFLKYITQLGTKEKAYLVLEVTSHGIDQNRIWGIPFVIAGLTNITHEHLDYHKTYENYVATKAKLLKKAKVAIINKDDKSYKLVTKKIKNKNVITYGLGKDADINPSSLKFETSLPGKYNIYNCLLAIAICRQLGISDEDIKKGIKTFIPPTGRTEIVYKKDFTVMVDFAHTPNAFEQLLPALKPQVKGKLIHVFGSAGLRDASKRSLMGKASGSYADTIILTAEDPRTEKIEDINKQIKSGILTKKNITLLEIPNRQDAIIKAVSLAKKDDFVLVTGKAHEKSINYGHGEEPWDEYKAIKKALELKYE